MTIISFKHKFIFLANMKCGSTTLHLLLMNYLDQNDKYFLKSIFEKPLGKHANALEVKKYIESLGYKWCDFFVFTTIREPLDRFKSCYLFESKNNKMTFEQYINKGRYYEHFRDIDNFTYPGVDLVIKMEEFNTEIPKLLNKLGLPTIPHNSKLNKINKTKTNSKVEEELESIKKNIKLIEKLKKRHPNDFSYYYSSNDSLND